MKLVSTRSLEQIKPVLKDPSATGPDPVYSVYTELGIHRWNDRTVIGFGRYNGEYPKTYGHYHTTLVDETYFLVSGDGILELQKKHLENGVWTPEKVDEVYLIKVNPGEEIIITPEWGHSWSNFGGVELISYDNWSAGHQPQDYEAITKLHGMAYYLIDKDSVPQAVPNPNYKDLPKPIWTTVPEFRSKIPASNSPISL